MEDDITDITVTINCVTYNQKDFIKQVLEGFINQKTNFKFEALVHDDCSTDGTTEIINEYAKNYPDIIIPIFEEKNRMQKEGCYDINIEMYSKARGKYIAFCDGDDYWIDENKLQTQVDFLDNNPDFAGVFHKSLRKNILTGEDICYMPIKEKLKGRDIFTIKDTLYGYFMETCSVMYRFGESVKQELIQSFPKEIINGDTFLIYFFSLKGKIKYIDKLMSIKNIGNQGIWNSVEQSKAQRDIRFWLEIINFPIEVRKLLDNNNCNLSYIAPEIPLKMVLVSAIELKRYDIIEKISRRFSDTFKNIVTVDIDFIYAEIERQKKKVKKYKKILKILILTFILALILIAVLAFVLIFLIALTFIFSLAFILTFLIASLTIVLPDF